MKQLIIFSGLICCSYFGHTQKYPDPEFSNEVYYLKKDSVNSAVRLEKGSSKMDSKTKMGGFGGYESGYILDGERSATRLHTGNNLSFIYSTGPSAAARSADTDSMMRANGMDPAMMGGMSMGGGMMDPSNTITLYKAEAGKGKRKILMMKAGGFGNKKNSSSDKYTFSVKKIRDGYWELVIDKTLPKGEYAFSVMGMGGGGMDGSSVFYSFSVE